MLELAGATYLVSTVAFALIALLVGVRLVLLSRETKKLPERLLGFGLMLTACFGYGLLIGTSLARAGSDTPDAAVYAIASGAGWILHDLGVLCVLAFVVTVFRKDSRWARRLAYAMGAVLWISLAGYASAGGLRHGLPDFWYWAGFSVIGTYQLWVAFEALHYYSVLRRRLALGLVEEIVANRFLLWGLGALSGMASIWIVNVPAVAGVTLGSEEGRQLSAVSMLATSMFGTGTVSVYWLTFFPPRWYRRRFPSARAAEAPPTA